MRKKSRQQQITHFYKHVQTTSTNNNISSSDTPISLTLTQHLPEKQKVFNQLFNIRTKRSNEGKEYINSYNQGKSYTLHSG